MASIKSHEVKYIFLAVQNSSIGDNVPCLLGLTELTIRVFTTLQSEPRDLSPLKHLIRVMRSRVAEVARARKRRSPKSLDSDENFKP